MVENLHLFTHCMIFTVLLCKLYNKYVWIIIPGSLMTIAWLGFAAVAIFMARYMRLVWEDEELLGTKVWFTVHCRYKIIHHCIPYLNCLPYMYICTVHIHVIALHKYWTYQCVINKSLSLSGSPWVDDTGSCLQHHWCHLGICPPQGLVRGNINNNDLYFCWL